MGVYAFEGAHTFSILGSLILAGKEFSLSVSRTAGIASGTIIMLGWRRVCLGCCWVYSGAVICGPVNRDSGGMDLVWFLDEWKCLPGLVQVGGPGTKVSVRFSVWAADSGPDTRCVYGCVP